MTYLEIESENAKLRSELVELRAMFADTTEKLGTLAAIIGCEADKSLPVLVDQAHIALEAAQLLNGASITAAAKWIETYWRATKGETGIIVEPKTDDSWMRFANEAQSLIAALRKR